MTTTTSALQAPDQLQGPDRLSWASLIWIGAMHVGSLLAFVPAYFSGLAWACAFSCTG